MPELPEVETVANGVDVRVRGQRIVSVWTSGKPQTFKSAESEIEEVLTGARIDRVRRVGKTIVMSLGRVGAARREANPPPPAPQRAQAPAGHQEVAKNDSNKSIGEFADGVGPVAGEFLVHLGMTGRLLVCGGGAAAGAYACGAVAGGRARGAVCGSAAVWAAVGE